MADSPARKPEALHAVALSSASIAAALNTARQLDAAIAAETLSNPAQAPMLARLREKSAELLAALAALDV